MIKVKALMTGFYGNLRRKPGAEFFIKNEQEFSKRWMTKIKGGNDIPEPKTKVSTGTGEEGAGSEALTEMLQGTVSNVIDYLNMTELTEEDLVQLHAFEEKGGCRKGVLEQIQARLDEVRAPDEE